MEKLREKTVVLIRHAERAKEGAPLADNGLSPNGKRQAENLADYFEKRFASAYPVLLSSPKRRCIETLKPLATRTKKKIEIDPLLLELNEEEGEASEAFSKRVQKFYDKVKKSSAPFTLACSHGDFVPTFLQLVIGASVELKTGEWIEIVLVGNHAVGSLKQSFDQDT